MKDIKRKFRYFLQKVPENVLNVLLVLSFIAFLLAFFDVETLKKIEICDISSYANTIDNFWSKHLYIFEYIQVKVIVCIAFGILFLLRICKALLCPKVIVICHNSFSNTISPYDESIVTDYAVKKIDINLVDKMEQSNIVGAICDQDRIIKETLKECDEYTTLIYYGIAHIPLIFRAGFQIGDEGSVRLLHKYRDNQSIFKEISTDPEGYRAEMNLKSKRYNRLSKEMLVVVATSLQVTDSDLCIFRNENINCELIFHMRQSSMYNFDAIDSYAAMNRLRTNVLQNIRNIVKRESIERIHLVLATSSDFTFFLAQGFSQHHDPEIIVYQYDHGTGEKYPWGISNKQPPQNAVVDQREHPL